MKAKYEARSTSTALLQQMNRIFYNTCCPQQNAIQITPCFGALSNPCSTPLCSEEKLVPSQLGQQYCYAVEKNIFNKWGFTLTPHHYFKLNFLASLIPQSMAPKPTIRSTNPLKPQTHDRTLNQYEQYPTFNIPEYHTIHRKNK